MRTIILPAGKDAATGEGLQLILNFKHDPDRLASDEEQSVDQACKEIIRTAPSMTTFGLITGLVAEMRKCNPSDYTKWTRVFNALKEI